MNCFSYLLLLSRILQFWGSQQLDPGSLSILISAEAVGLCHSEMKFNWRLPDPAALFYLTCKILPLREVIAFGCHL